MKRTSAVKLRTPRQSDGPEKDEKEDGRGVSGKGLWAESVNRKWESMFEKKEMRGRRNTTKATVAFSENKTKKNNQTMMTQRKHKPGRWSDPRSPATTFSPISQIEMETSLLSHSV